MNLQRRQNRRQARRAAAGFNHALQRLTGSGSAREKKRAVVAVARKLAVLLLSLWKHGTDYEPRATARPALVVATATA